jgi:predicted RND superfamily exporter protein
MSRLVTLPLRVPALTVAVIALITVALGYHARSIRIDAAIENLLPAHDPDRLYYEEAKRVFGSEEATVVGVFADDVFAPATLAKVDALSRELQAIDGVREVLSLTTMKGAESDAVGVRVGRLMRSLPGTPQEAAAFKERVLAQPLSAGALLARDMRATAVVVLFEPLSDEELLERRIEDRIREAVSRLGGPEEYAVTGLQTLKVNGARLMQDDLTRFVPVSVLLVIIVLIWEFRTLRGVLLPLISLLTGVIWTTGLMALSGADINIGTMILPPLLMAIGVAYAIHVVSRYYYELTPGRSRQDVVAATMAHVWVPVTAAWLTTVLGCGTLLLSPIRAIRDFGLYSVIGITVVFVVSVFLVPALLLLLTEPRHRPPGTDEGGWLAELLDRVGNAAVRRRRMVLVFGVALCALSAWAATRMHVETDYLQFFSPSSQVRVDNARIAAHLGGAQPIYVVIDGDEPQSIRRLETLAAIKDLQGFIAEQPGVDGSLSLVDLLGVLQSVLNPEAGPALPASQADVDQLLLFADPSDVRPVVNRDFSRANVIVRTHLSSSRGVGDFVRAVEEYARSRFRRGVEVHATGTVVLLNRSADALARGQVAGLWQVLAVLLVLMSFLFVSVRAGLLSLVPNVVPIVVLFGVMGWTGIDLNISTSMIAVIAIGIAVDDTIHYFNEFNIQIRKTGSQERAILNVVRSIGRPIVFTSLALAAGFLVMCVSNFQPIRQFGFLASITMAVALVAELLITPAVVMTTTIITLWDLLYVKLGPEPHREVPLFSGLRPVQAKIVVLMARLAAAAPGTYITQRGELKAELYVLLSGRAEVKRAGSQRVIRTLGRGDVIGEMGLVRQRVRSADVVVAEAAEYLVLDGGFLERIQRRHPRIAAKVFLNLTRILSDRLESTTDQLVTSAEGKN